MVPAVSSPWSSTIHRIRERHGHPNCCEFELGDGADEPDVDYPTTLDLITHEYVHGVVQHTARLTYSDESGALNEAIADTFGALVSGQWEFFAQGWRGTESPALSNFPHPTNDRWDLGSPREPHNAPRVSPGISCERAYTVRARALTHRGHGPDHYHERYIVPCRPNTDGSPGFGDAIYGLGRWWDNGGVHVNSQIISHMFFLLAQGGQHRLGGRVQPIGGEATGNLLFHLLQNVLVGQPRACFAAFRVALLDAAIDVLDQSAFDAVQTAAAAVGLPTSCPAPCSDDC